MSDKPPPDSTPAEALPPSASSRKVIDAKHDGRVWTTDQLNELELRDGKPSRRSIISKMFDLGAWGWIKLAVLCLAVGAVLQASGINPFASDFTLGGAAASLGHALVNTALWALANGWAPALIGAIVVLPLWLLWRLLSVPFRR
jgi:hypothetical protein